MLFTIRGFARLNGTIGSAQANEYAQRLTLRFGSTTLPGLLTVQLVFVGQPPAFASATLLLATPDEGVLSYLIERPAQCRAVVRRAFQHDAIAIRAAHSWSLLKSLPKAFASCTVSAHC